MTYAIVRSECVVQLQPSVVIYQCDQINVCKRGTGGLRTVYWGLKEMQAIAYRQFYDTTASPHSRLRSVYPVLCT